MDLARMHLAGMLGPRTWDRPAPHGWPKDGRLPTGRQPCLLPQGIVCASRGSPRMHCGAA